MNSNNNNYKDDPRYTPYYYFGLSFFTSGILLLTMMPAILHYGFFYPINSFFTLPAGLFLAISIILWRFAPNTELHQAIIIGCGLIYFGIFEILITFTYLTLENFCLYLAITAIGFGFILSASNIKDFSVKISFNKLLLYLSSLLSLLLIIYSIYTYAK